MANFNEIPASEIQMFDHVVTISQNPKSFDVRDFRKTDTSIVIFDEDAKKHILPLDRKVLIRAN